MGSPRFCWLGGSSYRVYRREAQSSIRVQWPLLSDLLPPSDKMVSAHMRKRMYIYGRKVSMGNDAIAYVVFMGKKQSKIYPPNPVNVISFSSEGYKKIKMNVS